MEKCGNHERAESEKPGGLAACSACAGDYEDPDRTAWRTDEEEIVDDDDLEIVSEIGSAVRDSNLVEGTPTFGKNAATDTVAGWRRNDGKASDEG